MYMQCTACTGLHCMYMSNYISRSPATFLSAFESVTTPPHSACTRSTRFYSCCPSHVRYSCFSLFHANDAVRHREAVAAGCVSQKWQDCEVSNFLQSEKSRRKAFTAWRTYDYQRLGTRKAMRPSPFQPV